MDSLWPQRCPAVTDDGSLLAAVGVEEQALRSLSVWSEGQSWPGPSDIRRQSPHDGIVASEAVTVVVVVDYGDFDSHAVQVNHTIDHTRGLGCSNTWGREKVSETFELVKPPLSATNLEVLLDFLYLQSFCSRFTYCLTASPSFS